MAITQNIGIIPEAGHRGIDAREAFVTKQEAFQDHLTDTFVTEINTLKTQINNEMGTLNVAVATATTKANQASASATTASTKASEANSSANQALTYKNQLQGYVIPVGTSYSVDQLNTKYSAMTKAQFNALAEERKANRAGSGFDSFGYTRINLDGINEGISTGNNVAGLVSNEFYLGNGITNFKPTTQKTNYPLININGSMLKITGVNSIGTNVINNITLPTAPNIYPYDTVLTAEQIASGVIKHADASNSGLIVNGKFDVDTSGWIALKSTIASVSSSLRITLTAADGGAYQDVPTEVGKKYIFEVDSIFGTNSDITIKAFASGFTTLLADNTSSSQGRKTLEFTATTNITRIYLLIRNSIGKYCNFKNAALFPADAISRSDLVFLESWHEDISEKNFIYPLGNVQYLGGNTDGLTGITNGAFTGFETYSLFGFVN